MSIVLDDESACFWAETILFLSLAIGKLLTNILVVIFSCQIGIERSYLIGRILNYNNCTNRIRPPYDCMKKEDVIHTLVNEPAGNEIPMNKPKMTPQHMETISLIVSAGFKQLELHNILQELKKLSRVEVG